MRSRIFERTGKIDIGMLLSTADSEPDLCKVIILAFFQSLGKFPEDREILIIWANAWLSQYGGGIFQHTWRKVNKTTGFLSLEPL